ncbi:MAG: DinB family protein [Gemmatimonadales bacterium]|jgi:uncharacterized damage-inducible protein DinB|nr:MAG: DinB family protein [Gemmatimonadales bacterium]
MDGKTLIPEFDQEAATTRKTLERVPFDRADWKPHEKSSPLGELAAHVADIPAWVAVTVNQDVFEMEGPYELPKAESVEELLEIYDRNVAEARAVLEGASAADLMGTWSMKQEGEIVFSMPKMAVLRSFVFSHAVHHRAQLGVYLRLLDVPVPATYGPSADEEM